MQQFINLVKLICFVWFCLLWATEEEQIALEETINEEECNMGQKVVSQEELGPSSFAVVYHDGAVTINDDGMRLIELSPEEAYNLLAFLYSHEHILRQREDTVPLESPSTGYAPRYSNYHDHRCSCLGCNYDGPDPTEEEIQQMMAQVPSEPEMPQWAQPEGQV